MNRLADKFRGLEQKIPAPLPEEDEFYEFEDLEDKPPESDGSVEVKIPPIINPIREKKKESGST